MQREGGSGLTPGEDSRCLPVKSVLYVLPNLLRETTPTTFHLPFDRVHAPIGG